MFNNSLEYARSRIQGTWVKVKAGELFKLVNAYQLVSRGRTLDGCVIVDGDGISKYPIETMSYQFGPLGYLNSNGDGEAHYITRMPLRRDWKQGLREPQLVSKHKGRSSGVRQGFIRNERKAFEDIINSKYPSIDRALDIIEDTGGSAALHRKFKLDKDYKLFYREEEVGRLNKDEKLVLTNKFEFLQQELDEAVGAQHVAR